MAAPDGSQIRSRIRRAEVLEPLCYSFSFGHETIKVVTQENGHAGEDYMERDAPTKSVRVNGAAKMNSEFLVTCPYCGEEIEIYLEPDTSGRLVQDCEVCCNPWELHVTRDGVERYVDVRRADGSE